MVNISTDLTSKQYNKKLESVIGPLFKYCYFNKLFRLKKAPVGDMGLGGGFEYMKYIKKIYLIFDFNEYSNELIVSIGYWKINIPCFKESWVNYLEIRINKNDYNITDINYSYSDIFLDIIGKLKILTQEKEPIVDFTLSQFKEDIQYKLDKLNGFIKLLK